MPLSRDARSRKKASSFLEQPETIQLQKMTGYPTSSTIGAPNLILRSRVNQSLEPGRWETFYRRRRREQTVTAGQKIKAINNLHFESRSIPSTTWVSIRDLFSTRERLETVKPTRATHRKKDGLLRVSSLGRRKKGGYMW